MQVVLTLGIGGTERLVVELCQRLQHEFRMTVCALDAPGVWADELHDCGIDVVPLQRRPGFKPSLASRIARLTDRHQAALVHCHHYSPFVYGSLATLLRPGLRMVFTEHGRLSDGPPSLKKRLINPLLGRVPTALLAVSDALRASMIDEGFPARRLQVIHNGIEPGTSPTDSERRNVRRTLGIAPSTIVIGTIARLNHVKDLGTLIEAFAIISRQHQEIVLIVVGDGEERNRLEEIARRLGVLSEIRFLGQRDDARRLLAAFDVYVNSSISEGISLTILEAMAAELPVVATRVGGTPEVVADGISGLLVPARTPAALADAIRQLAVDRGRRRAMGTSGRLTLVQGFSIHRMVDQYAELYRRLGS